MILSAVALFKKFKTDTPLGASEWGIEEKHGVRVSHVSYSGHAEKDGSVRIYARFGRPIGAGKKSTVLLIPDAGKPIDEELFWYFLEKGYAVLMPDYSGKMQNDPDGTLRTVYPPSLAHGNFEQARGLLDMQDLEAEETTWFEWTYVALFSLEYLRSREEVGNIGVIGIRTGGDIAWQTLLSPHVKCGVPVNAVGWRSFSALAKFGENVAHNLSDDTHKYIAGVEAQSYAAYVKCPVLMLCALHDSAIDCDRAYDTYSRLGLEEGNALVYSSSSGACIGPNALTDMDLFLEKNLKGREIYIPDTLNVQLKEVNGELEITVECDKEGLLDEAGIFYSESDVKTRCAYRDWHRVFKTSGKTVKNGTFTHTIKPFAGTSAAFVYAYAKYINGFRVMSKITAKKLKADPTAVKNRMLYSGKEMDAFVVEQYKDYSVGDIFLEREAAIKACQGYGGIKGLYSVGGMRMYKISSPQYIPDENALLKFDVYSKQTNTVKITVSAGDVETGTERYSYFLEISGGGKWKRIILKSGDFKSEYSGKSLRNFSEGRALSFEGTDEEKEFALTNILWL